MSSNLLKKLVSFSIGNIITLVISVITVPIVTRILSPEQYGKTSMFTLASSIITTIILMGCEQSFVRFFYEEREESRTKLLYRCIKVPVIMSIIVSIIIIVLRQEISNFLFKEYAFKVILLLIIHTVFMAINTFAMLVIRMQQKGNTYSVLLVMNKLVNFLLIILLTTILKNDYKVLIIAAVVSNLLVTICAIFFEIKFWKYEDNKDIVLKNNAGHILKFGVPLLFTFMINWVFQSIDKISIMKWATYEELGIYSSAFNLVGVLTVIQTSFTTFWTPVAFERYEKSPEDKGFFEKINKITSFIMLGVAILLILFKDIVILLLGAEYKSAAYVMPFLVFMPVMYTISETTQIGINFAKKSKCHIIVGIVSCVADIIAIYLLVPVYGAKGAAIATGIAYITFFTMRTFLSLRYYKVNFNIKKFYIMTLLISLFALYATFNSINLVYIIIGIVEILVLGLLYKDIVKELFSIVLNLLGKNLSK